MCLTSPLYDSCHQDSLNNQNQRRVVQDGINRVTSICETPSVKMRFPVKSTKRNNCLEREKPDGFVRRPSRGTEPKRGWVWS